jgi:hypothetical protein
MKSGTRPRETTFFFAGYKASHFSRFTHDKSGERARAVSGKVKPVEESNASPVLCLF